MAAKKLLDESNATDINESVRKFNQKLRNSQYEFVELNKLAGVLIKDDRDAIEALRQAQVAYRQKKKRIGLELKLGIDPIEFNPTGGVEKTHRLFRVVRDGERRIPFKVHRVNEAPPDNVVWGTYDADTNRIKVPIGDTVVMLGDSGLVYTTGNVRSIADS